MLLLCYSYSIIVTNTMIDVTALDAAAIRDKDTGSQELATIRAYVTMYNSAGLRRSEKVAILHRLMLSIASWVTLRRPKAATERTRKFSNRPGMSKNADRWAALEELADQVSREGKLLNVHFLTGPARWEDITATERSYWLEAVSDEHFAGQSLSPHYQAWLLNPHPGTSFWDWLRGTNRINGLSRVSYDETLASMSKVQFQAGVLHSGLTTDRASTQGFSTVQSGTGWGFS